MRGASKVPEASVNGIFISLWTLAYLDLAAPEARPIKQIFDGMGSVLRFVLDHPLDQLKPFGMTTSSFCAILCATVFGKGEDSRDKGGFEFSQDLVNEVVMTHSSWLSGPLVAFFPTLPAHFLCALVNLCISDLNKPMLVKCPDLIATLVSGLIVDPEHQRKDMAEPLRAGIQRNSVECFLQLALFGEGRELLKRHTEALDALRMLSDGGALTEETSVAASSALAAVEGRLPRPGPLPEGEDEKHIMMSCRTLRWLHFSAVRLRIQISLTIRLCIQTSGTCRRQSNGWSLRCSSVATWSGSVRMSLWFSSPRIHLILCSSVCIRPGVHEGIRSV